MGHQTTNLGVRSSNLFGRATKESANHRYFFALRRLCELLRPRVQVTEKELCGRTAAAAQAGIRPTQQRPVMNARGAARASGGSNCRGAGGSPPRLFSDSRAHGTGTVFSPRSLEHIPEGEG
jgi:hypothetical protein